MNVRIKELAKEATQKFSRFAEQESWENLFAELIVQECIRKVSDLMDYTDYKDNEKSMVELKTLRDARQVIKEHFGIEK